jgi:hypothetical protein
MEEQKANSSSTRGHMVSLCAAKKLFKTPANKRQRMNFDLDTF